MNFHPREPRVARLRWLVGCLVAVASSQSLHLIALPMALLIARPSVRLSVRHSVGRSVGPSVWRSISRSITRTYHSRASQVRSREAHGTVTVTPSVACYFYSVGRPEIVVDDTTENHEVARY